MSDSTFPSAPFARLPFVLPSLSLTSKPLTCCSSSVGLLAATSVDVTWLSGMTAWMFASACPGSGPSWERDRGFPRFVNLMDPPRQVKNSLIDHRAERCLCRLVHEPSRSHRSQERLDTFNDGIKSWQIGTMTRGFVSFPSVHLGACLPARQSDDDPRSTGHGSCPQEVRSNIMQFMVHLTIGTGRDFFNFNQKPGTAPRFSPKTRGRALTYPRMVDIAYSERGLHGGSGSSLTACNSYQKA